MKFRRGGAQRGDHNALKMLVEWNCYLLFNNFFRRKTKRQKKQRILTYRFLNLLNYLPQDRKHSDD